MTILTLVALDFTRYVLATLLALAAAGLAALIGVGYVGMMLFALLFSGLVGGAFAVRDVPAGHAWGDCGWPRT